MSKVWFFGDSFAHPPYIKDLSEDKNNYWWGTKLLLEDIYIDTLNYWNNDKRLDYDLKILGGVHPL